MIIGLDGNEANVKERVGSGQYAFELLHQFAKNKQHQFVVYVKENPLHNLPHQTANFRYTVFGPHKLWTQFALPLKLFFGKKPDVFFSMGHYGPRFSKTPYVVTIHDLSYLHFPQMFNKNDLYQLVNWTKYSIRNCAQIIAVSKATKDDIIKNYKIPASKIAVTYEGYDKKRFKPQSKTRRDLVRAKYKIKAEYIIFVGTLQPRKNLERLIEAFSLLTQNSRQRPASQRGERGSPKAAELRTQNLFLVVVGKKGWLYDSIFQKVKDFGLDQKVLFADYVPDDDLPALISGAKAYVLPSFWEGFGIPVIESQACGVPVVVSNTSSLPEIIGDSGILVDPQSVNSIAKGITTVLESGKTRRDLVEKGFKNIKRFSWQTCAQQTLDVLEKVALRSRPIV